jgi:hypothetical protein
VGISLEVMSPWMLLVGREKALTTPSAWRFGGLSGTKLTKAVSLRF